MEFSKAIQIKKLVTSWNSDRVTFGYGYVKCECMMFSLGNWSVTLKPVDTKIFFSHEVASLIKLCGDGSIVFIIGSTGCGPYIDMQ